MSTVAEQLRSAREAQKLTVQQIADATKIRTDHIHALEKGDFSVFSAPIYIRGSVKNYATRLKLDLPQIMAALDAEIEGHGKIQRAAALERSDQNPARQRHVFAREAEPESGAGRRRHSGGHCRQRAGVHTVMKHRNKNGSAGKLPPAVYQPANPGDTLPLPRK